MAELDPVVGGTPIETDTFGNPVLKRIVQRFATAAARAAANPTPEAGETTYLADRGTLEFYHGGSWRSTFPPGVILDYGGSSAPAGFLLCQGQAVSRTTFDALFAVIGTNYGDGDGSTTFNIPDFRRRYSMGVAASGLGDTLGATFGNINHVHAGPSHTHSGPSHSHSNPENTGSSTAPHFHTNPNTDSAGSHSHTNPNTSTGGSHTHTTGGPVGTTLVADGAKSAANMVHTHTVNSGGSHSHSQGNTGSGGGHSHGIGNTGTSVSSTSHNHSMGSTGSSGTGDTGSSGTGNTGSANPPTLTVNKIIKT